MRSVDDETKSEVGTQPKSQQVGIQPVGIQQVGIQQVGIQQVGSQPVGIQPVGIQLVGWSEAVDSSSAAAAAAYLTSEVSGPRSVVRGQWSEVRSSTLLRAASCTLYPVPCTASKRSAAAQRPEARWCGACNQLQCVCVASQRACCEAQCTPVSRGGGIHEA